MAFCSKIFHILLLLCLFHYGNTRVSKITAKNINNVCEINLYKIEINIKIENPLNEYKNFYLNVAHEQSDLLFKCIIDPQKNQIICITNLEQQKKFLEVEETLTLPYPFPEIDGIIWDYFSFVSFIYRRTITIREGCGTTVVKSKLYNVNPSKWDLITKINKIYNGQCLVSDSSENFYTFMMNLNILGGNLKDSFDSQTIKEITFLQNITIPFSVGHLKLVSSSSDNFYSNKYYKTAFCFTSESITNTNYLKKNGFEFKCNIPMNEQYILNGPLKIVSFTDNIYANVVKSSKETKTDFVSIYFSTEKVTQLNQNPNDEEPDEKIENKNDDEEEDIIDDINDDSEEDNKEDNKKENEEDNKEDNKKENEEDNKKDNNEDNEEDNKEDDENKPFSSSSGSNTASSSPSSSPSSSSSSKPSSSSSSSASSSIEKLLKVKSSSSSSGASSSKPASSSNLRRLDIPGAKSNKEFLLLDDSDKNFICPDAPFFIIPNFKEGIVYEPIPEQDDKFNIILTGHLKYGLKKEGNKIKPLQFTSEDINFNLTIINNLAEKVSEKKNNIYCTINSGSMFLKEEITKIKCLGQKKEQTKKQNTDLSINWSLKENKFLNNIIIKWPKDLNDITVHSKKIYSYEIYAFSIKKTDYDCFDDQFYFYIDILDINSEPEINFNISMLNPEIEAQCKLYTSDSLKCFFDLRLKKIKKGTNIRLPLPGNYNISTAEGNYINLTVFNFIDENDTEVPDDGIIVDKTCGNNVVVGAIQGIGYNYISAIILIICFCLILGTIVFFILVCIGYEITHRDRKGQYFSHVEEKSKEVNNTTTTAGVANNNQNATIGIGLPKV